jgi:hypothetical protein
MKSTVHRNTHGNLASHSEKVRTLLEEIPRSLVIWGTSVVIVIFLILLLIVCFTPYPYSNGESIIQHIIVGVLE